MKPSTNKRVFTIARCIPCTETTRRAMGRGAIEYGCWPADVGQEYEDAPTEVS
jgi:hypothetical protein